MDFLKFVSIRRVIRSVQGIFKIEGSSWINDVPDWIGEAIEEMGTGVELKPTHRDLEVKNHRLLLPCSIEVLRGVFYEDHFLLAKNNAFVNQKVLKNNLPVDRREWYKIIGNYIQTSFEKGTVTIYYETVPLDKDGLPMIIDNPKMIQALRWKIVSFLLLGGYKHSQLTFDYADMRYRKLRDEVSNDMKMPRPEEIGTVLAGWMDVRPNFDNGLFLTNHNEQDSQVVDDTVIVQRIITTEEIAKNLLEDE